MSLAESVTRHVPMREDCTGKPGKLYVSAYNKPLCSRRGLTMNMTGLRGDMPASALREGDCDYIRKP